MATTNKNMYIIEINKNTTRNNLSATLATKSAATHGQRKWAIGVYVLLKALQEDSLDNIYRPYLKIRFKLNSINFLFKFIHN